MKRGAEPYQIGLTSRAGLGEDVRQMSLYGCVLDPQLARGFGGCAAGRDMAGFRPLAQSFSRPSRRCIQKRGVRRFLYASSMAAYGDVRELPAHEDASPSVPVSYYGLSKLASEHLLRLASREGLSVTSFRMFSVYGPGQNLGNLKQGMASIYLAYLLRGEPVPVSR